MDELAHANLPGERHAKRWQDVSELLFNGIDAYATLNVANIESLGEVVSGSPARTGPSRCRTRSCGPARSRWSTLRLRRCGTGWPGPRRPGRRVDAALSSYFRFANLAGLRELAQLWLDDSVPDPVTAFLAARGISGPVNASVIVVGLKGSPADDRSSVTPPISPGCPMPGSKGRTSGRSTTSAAHRRPGWRRTAGCLAN